MIPIRIQSITRLFKRHSFVSVVVVSLIAVWLAGNLGAFGLPKIHHDLIGYHAYGPAVFVKKDPKLTFLKDSAGYYCDRGMYCPLKAPNGNPVIKCTAGISLMYLPFTIWPFLFYNESGMTGYELPFSIAICCSCLFYFIAALFMLRRLLQELKFEDRSIAFAIYCIGLGTNILVYASVHIGMAHVYGFFLFVCALWLAVKWYREAKWKYALLLGLCFGLLILIRPSNLLMLLAFILFDAQNAKKTFHYLRYNIWQLTVMATMAALVILPQLLYWKAVTGEFLFNSYVGERFFFQDPKIAAYLFGFRKGWFIYTPLALLGLWGFYQGRKSNPFFFGGLLIFLLMIYINSAWWCWWFGGGFGARAMIESYPLLGIGLAFLYTRYQQALARRFLLATSMLLIIYNLKSTQLFRVNVIHYDSMTFQAFVRTIPMIYPNDAQKAALSAFYQEPDYEKARLNVGR